MGITKEVSQLTIERMTGIIQDVIWIGINSYLACTLMHPVKFLINNAVQGKTQDLALRMAGNTMGAVQICGGLVLHWQHVYNETQGVVIEFAISGRDVKEMGYIEFVENAMEYFEHLNKTGSRTF